MEWNSKRIGALPVPMQLRLLDRPFVRHNLMSKSWELCSFTKVPDRPHTSTSDILWVQEKGAQISMAESSFGLSFPPVQHTSCPYIRDAFVLDVTWKYEFKSRLFLP